MGDLAAQRSGERAWRSHGPPRRGAPWSGTGQRANRGRMPAHLGRRGPCLPQLKPRPPALHPPLRANDRLIRRTSHSFTGLFDGPHASPSPRAQRGWVLRWRCASSTWAGTTTRNRPWGNRGGSKRLDLRTLQECQQTPSPRPRLPRPMASFGSVAHVTPQATGKPNQDPDRQLPRRGRQLANGGLGRDAEDQFISQAN
jgi:hypothetical protein